MIIKVIKVRLYPTKAQSCLMDQIFGCCRFVYNYGLKNANQTIRRTRKQDIARLVKC